MTTLTFLNRSDAEHLQCYCFDAFGVYVRIVTLRQGYCAHTDDERVSTAYDEGCYPNFAYDGELPATPVVKARKPRFAITPHLEHWRVDEVIECLEVSGETRRALLDALPNAYGVPEPGAERDSPRERPFKLARIWRKLAPAVKADIRQALEREHAH